MYKYNYMEKADFLYCEFEAPNGFSIIMFQDSSVKVSPKIRKNIRCACFLVISLLILQNRGYSAFNGPILYRVTHKTDILENAN